MSYLVSRNGQTYGPYTLDDLQRYVASGHVQLTDLAQAQTEDAAASPEWKPVSQLLAELGVTPSAPGATTTGIPHAAPAFAAPAPGYPHAGYAVAPGAYPPPPDLSWGLMLLFSVLTCGLFSIIYDLVQASWLKRIRPNTRVQLFYIVAAVLWFLNMTSSVSNSAFAASHGRSSVAGGLAALAALGYFVFLILARFTMRGELEEHYNTVEPIGLTLGGIMTFFFGGLYFQYHFNRINQARRAMLYGSAGVLPR